MTVTTDMREYMIASNAITPDPGMSIQQLTAEAPARDEKGHLIVSLLPARPTLQEVDAWLGQIGNSASQTTKYATEPEPGPQGPNFAKVEALAGHMLSNMSRGPISDQIVRRRGHLDSLKITLAEKRARVAVLAALPAEARTNETDGELLLLEDTIRRVEAEFNAGRDTYMRAPGLKAFILAAAAKGLPFESEKAIMAPFTGEDPLTWLNWINPYLWHTLPQGKTYAEHLLHVLENALVRRKTGNDPQYRNFDVRSSTAAERNQYTMERFRDELQAQIARQGAALTPLGVEDVLERICERHGRYDISLQVPAARGPEPEAKRARGASGYKAPSYADDGDAVPVKALEPAAGAVPRPASRPAAERRTGPLVSAHGSSWAVQSHSPDDLAAVMQRMAELGYPQYPPSECWNCAGDPSVPASKRLHWAFICPKRPPHAPRNRWARNERAEAAADSYDDAYEYEDGEDYVDESEVCGRCGETGHHHSACPDPPTRAKGKAPVALPAPAAE
eukprot:tig00021254_g19712.t1